MLRYIPKGIKNICTKKILYMNIYSSIIHYGQKVEATKYQSADKWINKMWYIHITEYYSAIKRNEVLICATTWMNPVKTLCGVKVKHKSCILYDTIYIKCEE